MPASRCYHTQKYFLILVHLSIFLCMIIIHVLISFFMASWIHNLVFSKPTGSVNQCTTLYLLIFVEDCCFHQWKWFCYDFSENIKLLDSLLFCTTTSIKRDVHVSGCCSLVDPLFLIAFNILS